MKTPYDELRALPVWEILERALDGLVENGDVREMTPRDYVVGYLVKALGEAGLATGDGVVDG